MTQRRLADAFNAASLRSQSTLRAIIVAYSVISVLWIFGSDTAVGWLVHDPAVVAVVGLAKGLLFVFSTSALFFWLLTRVAHEPASVAQKSATAPRLARCVDGLAILAATLIGLAIVHVAWPKRLGSSSLHHVVAWLLVAITVAAIGYFARWVLHQGGQLAEAIHERDQAQLRLQSLESVESHRDELQALVKLRTSELEAERDRAEQASEAKSAFVASMSHELRTPLNTIVGLAYMLKRSKLRGADADRAALIDEAARHLLAMVDSVLDLAKIEARKFQLANEDFSLCAVLEAARTLTAPSAEAKGLELTLECDASAVLRGDATRLRQVVLNLAGNAVKYTRTGFVRIRARCEAGPEQRARAVIEVEDSGPGISPAMLERIFAPFERGGVIDEKSEGTGLGLYIARQFIEQMGGAIQAHSEVAKGSRFTVTIPFERGGAEPPVSATEVKSTALDALREQHAGAKVLVVDDEPINCDVARALLRSAALDAQCVQSAGDALERLASEDFALVLLDVQLGDTDGIELARQLREAPEKRSIPIIAVSAAAFEEDRRACLNAGMNDFIAKPIDPPSLFASILRQLNGERARAPSAPAPSEEPTIDAARGLASFAGQSAMYANAAAKFIETYAPTRAEREALTAADPVAAGRAAHRLRGIAGTLGARAIIAITQSYERAMRNGTPTDPRAMLRALDDLRTALSRAIVVLPDRLEPRAKRSTLALDHEMDLLRTRLIERDFEAAAHSRALQDALRERFGAAAQTLVESIESFDYPRALALLDELKAQSSKAPITQAQASR